MDKLRGVPPTPEPDNERKRNMLNIWIGKELGPEVEEMAAREALITGHTITKTDFGRELFLWALEFYRQAGSLAILKSWKAVPPSAVIERQLEIADQVIEAHAHEQGTEKGKDHRIKKRKA